MMMAPWSGFAQHVSPLRVVGDAIPQTLTGAPGDAARGRAIVASRQQGRYGTTGIGPAGGPR